MIETPRLLFVPVSGAYGMGEYARSLAIAQGAHRRWPNADIRFVLSREASYATNMPFPAKLLASSPTFHTAAVVELIDAFRPHVVIFDNAGRTAQLRAARLRGCRVVFISARRRQRRKAFRWRWMRLIDEHWIAYPEFVAGALLLSERVKLALLHRPIVRYLDVILARPAAGGDADASPISGAGEARDDGGPSGGYVLLVPGGGTGHPGASEAIAIFHDAARRLAQTACVVLVGRGGGLGPAPRLRVLDSVPQATLASLMRGARLIVANGGSTLLQAIACGKPCVAVAIAGDQRERIARCVGAQVAVAAPLDAGAIAAITGALLCDRARRVGLAERAVALALADGVDVAMRALSALLGDSVRNDPGS